MANSNKGAGGESRARTCISNVDYKSSITLRSGDCGARDMLQSILVLSKPVLHNFSSVNRDLLSWNTASPFGKKVCNHGIDMIGQNALIIRGSHVSLHNNNRTNRNPQCGRPIAMTEPLPPFFTFGNK